MKISDRAIVLARTYIGKTETKPNDAPWLRDLMFKGGNPASWTIGEPYCIAALLALFGQALAEVKHAFPFKPCAASQTCFDNAAAVGFTTDTPSIGDIVIFRLGDTWEGHAELVTALVQSGDKVIGVDTIGFNTSGTKSGDQRNGEGCFAKERLFSHFPKTDARQLWIRGYIKTSQL